VNTFPPQIVNIIFEILVSFFFLPTTLTAIVRGIRMVSSLLSVFYFSKRPYSKRQLFLEFLLFFLLLGCGHAERDNDFDQHGISNDSSLSFDVLDVLDATPKSSLFREKYDEYRSLEDAVVDDTNFDADELCLEYLLSFLGGTTDAKDNCEGIQNAFIGAHCDSVTDGDDDHDDYFTTYSQPTCCQSLKNHYDDNCGEADLITNAHLLLVACVLLLCEGAKSIITTHQLHFLPEAGGCVLVGVFLGLLIHILPGYNLDDVSFDEEFFLIVLLPPIIFEAALSVNKKEFRRRRLAILMFAVFGTILSTFLTGFMVYYSSGFFDNTMPLIDSLIFGALISSIDPVAILSVLSSLHLTEEDTIFIMVFGESLLNDGVAITLFKTLIGRYNEDTVSMDDVLGACADFLIVCAGSIIIGVICGFGCLVYFWLLRKKLNSAMEVASFFLWAGIPYYICDSIEFSGIVGIVAMGFFMDIYIAAPKNRVIVPLTRPVHKIPAENYVELGDNLPCSTDILCGVPPSSPSSKSLYSLRSLRTLNMRELVLREERFRLSVEADKHVRFVAHLLSQLSENAIFVYLGLFMFSKKYEWNMPLVCISIVACVLSRAIMVVFICSLVWYINVFRIRCGCHKPVNTLLPFDSEEPQISRTATSLQDRRIQLVLVLAGLRGAVSLALVESVPLYNAVTGEGSEYKPEMKAMTSASIIFTMFVFGGSAYYILRRLDIPKDEAVPSVKFVDGSGTMSNLVHSIKEVPEKSAEKVDRRPRPESPVFQ